MESARILIVEDEAVVAMDIQQTLTELGYQIAGQAATGDDAITQAAQERPDLVLLDIHLRGSMDGIEAGQFIGRELGVPVVYLTAHSDPQTVQRARLTAPFGYVLKPYDEKVLDMVIQMALYRHGLETELIAARHAAEQANQAKSSFLTRMTHELRTPLNAIIGFSDVIIDQESLDAESTRTYVGYIHDAGENLLGLVNGLLDVARQPLHPAPPPTDR